MADSEVEAHPEATFAVAVAPGDPADDSLFNSLRPGIVSIACFRLNDSHFDFDSSFIVPETRTDLIRLGEMRADYQDSPASIFGHADPVGTDAYNKTLSGNRAHAFHALLTRDTDAWEHLFNEHSWGLKSSQTILKFLRDEGLSNAPSEEAAGDSESGADDGASDVPPTGSAEDTEPVDPTEFEVDGKNSKEWKAAVSKFQDEQSLHVDGVAGPDTRKRLYEMYMAALCVDMAGTPFKFEPTDFLGKGKDKKGKAAFQGCSEFNPILILSKSDDDTLPKEDRNSKNAPNRRVVLYFFQPGLEIEVDKWPCPRVNEGSAGCRKRFWSDHEKRRKQEPDKARAYARQPSLGLEGTRDTFACRFYDRLARHSPCEAGVDEWLLQLLLPNEEQKKAEGGEGSEPDAGEAKQPPPPKKVAERKRAAGASFEAKVKGSDKVIAGQADANGLLRIRSRAELEEIVLDVRVPLETADGDDGGDGGEGANGGASDSDGKVDGKTEKRRFATVRLTLRGGSLAELHDAASVENARKDRLLNLGFGPTERKLWDDDPKVLPAALSDIEKVEGTSVNDDKLRELYGS